MAKRKPRAASNPWPARLKRLQERLGRDNQGMADRLEISVNTWNAWKYGQRLPAGPSRAAIRLLEEISQ